MFSTRSQAPQHRQDDFQHRGPGYTNTQTRHPNPGSVPSSGIPTGASPSPSSSPGVVNTQGLATGTAHDMSNKGAPSRPGLAPSPHQQGNVVQQQQQQPPPGMIIQQQYLIPQQRGAPMYVPMNNQQNPRGAIQIQQAPSSGPQQMTAGSPMNPINQYHQPFVIPMMPQGINMSQYQQRDQAVYQQQPHLSQPSQPQYQQRQVYQQRPQFNQQNPQGQIYTQPSTPPYYSNSQPVNLQPGGATFFQSNQQGMVVQPQMRPQAYTATVPQAPQYNAAPKKKSLIRIVDPKSNQDITDTIIREASMTTTGSSSPHSGQSSASGTPPAQSQTPPQNHQANEKRAAIQATFAAQVARLAHDAPAPHGSEGQIAATNQMSVNPPQNPLPEGELAKEPIKGAPPEVVAPAVEPQSQQGSATIPDPNPAVPAAAPGVVAVPNQTIKVEAALENQVVPALPEAAAKTGDIVQATPQAPSEVSSTKPFEQAATVVSESVKQPTVVEPTTKATPAVDSRTDMPPQDDPAQGREELQTESSDSDKGALPMDVKPLPEAAKQPNPTPATKDSEDQKPAEVDSKVVVGKQIDESVNKDAKDDVIAPTAQVVSKEKSETATVEGSASTVTASAKDPVKKKNQKTRLKDFEKKGLKDEDELEAYRSDAPEKQAPEEIETKSTLDEKTEMESESNATQEVKVKVETPAEVPSSEGKKKDPEEKEVVVEDTKEKQEQEKVESENAKNKEEATDEDPKASLKDNKIQLKYTYREDQWSPMNPEGKKQYGRDFLLQFQSDCKDKPEGLPHIPDIVLEKAEIRLPSTEMPSRINNRVDFTPQYLKSPRGSQPPPNFGQGVPGGRRSSKEPKKVIQRASQPPKLSTAGDKAWKPDKDVPDDTEEAKTLELMKKMKALLNKLTPNNFSKLKDQVLGYSIDTEERLKGVIDTVFEKAISEQAFSRTYAQLCRDLSQLRVPTTSGQGVVQFRTLLINRCQKEFEKEKNDEKEEQIAREAIAKLPVDQRGVAMDYLQLKLIKNKRRILGNIRFIGELFKLQMLIEQIMHDCIFKLLCSKDEESLECMSNLMSTIGKILDHEKAKNRIDQYFTQIKNIISQKKTSARIRFMLQDVVDLRQQRNWIPRRDTDNPKTLEQIHQDYKRDEERKKMEGLQAQMAPPPPRMSRNKRDQPQRVGPPPPEGWSTVTSTKATRVAVDPNKFKVMKQQSIDVDIQLGPSGPRSFGGWSRGSSGGSSKTQTEPPEPKQSNRFMMLSDERKGRVPESKGRGPQSLQGKRSSSSRERDEMSKERRSAIAEVQKMSQARRSQSREKDLDSRGSRGKQEAAPVSAPVREISRASAAPAISEDVFEKKAMATIEEFLSIKDIEEALMCVLELNSPSRMHILVRSAMNCSLEKNPGARDAAGLLFHKLIKAGHLSKEQFVIGVKEVLEYADDMALYIPMIWKYLGEIIGATFRDNSLSLKVLADTMEPVKAARKAGDLMAEILHTVVNLNSADVVGEMWQSSGFTWDMFLPSGKDVQEFVNNKKLGFTLLTGTSTTTNSGGDANANSLSDEDLVSLIKRELGSILATIENVNDKVFDWIQKNLNISSPEKQRLFIRALVTVVVQSTIQGDKAESCRMNHDLLNVRTAILKRYINNDNNLELQALYAVQALNQHLESPPRLLGLIFNVLYDEDVIPGETFYAWQKSSDPNETVGKGVALKSVTSFFDWLREAEEDPAK
ncbi:eukaryotic translation initiation factor 4 gamma 3-like [Asterias rubens]|uniref:eukaryotic translation initiation factor 4 gamma 3-like n=1 Tax=Asterias rubens TaxID=7604 RepID=UPI0014554F72|nr:eukaryotic translation initiation factor 4 gamma 3-like [Asterias rubens]